MSTVKKEIYQDKYNNLKTWQVCYLKGGFYLKQFINGVQFGKGLRCSKAFIQSIGIFDFNKVN